MNFYTTALKSLFTLICCSFLLGLSAQTNIGLRVGGSFTDYRFELINDGYTITPGLVVAAFASVPINEKVALQPEMQFVQRGFPDFSTDSNGFSVGEGIHRSNYLELPILIRYTGSGVLKFTLVTGASLGFLLSEGFDEDSGLYRRTFEGENFAQRSELFGILGVGLIYRRLLLDLRYVHGIGNRSFTKDFQINYTGFQVSLGYELFRRLH